MHRRSLFAAAALIAAGTSSVRAQSAPAKWADTVSMEIEKANESGDPAKLAAARALAERVSVAYPNDGLMTHYLGFALYREAVVTTGRGGNASTLLERAQALLEQSLKSHPLAETHALISIIDGQLIAADQSRAMELGMASSASSAAALSMGPNNPRVWLTRGQSAIYTPAEYGGGLKPAEDDLERAIELFAKDAPKPGDPSWGKAEAHVWLGQVYERTNDKVRAAAEYRTALSIAPDYAWAKFLLGNLNR